MWLWCRFGYASDHDLLLLLLNLLNRFRNRSCDKLTLLNRFGYDLLKLLLWLLSRRLHHLIQHDLFDYGCGHDLRFCDRRSRLRLNLLNRLYNRTGQDLLLLLLLLDLLHHRCGQQLLGLTIHRSQLAGFERRQHNDLVLLMATGSEAFRCRNDHNLLLLLAAGDAAEGFRRSQYHDLLGVKLLMLLVQLLLLLGGLRRSDHNLLGRFGRRCDLRLKLRARWLRFQDRLSRRFGALLQQGLRDLDRLWTACRGLLR